MIEPIAFHANVPVTALASVQAPLAPANMPAVNAVDQARFQAALQGVPTPSAIALPAAALASERVSAPGDLILRGLERLRGQYRAVGVELDTLANRADLTPMDLIGLQMQVAQVTLGTQLIGQVASKLEQNINTLLKSS
jgi:type III secretion system YscI/HrpB-like protein